MTGALVAVIMWFAASPWRGARRRAIRGPSKVVAVGAESQAATIEVAVVLDLLAAALSSGAGIPRALDAVGDAVGGSDGQAFRQVGAALLLGADWDAAWLGAPARCAAVDVALKPSWVHGAAPRDALRVAGAHVIQSARSRARTAAARLGVHLVLPLGLCLLPAFVLVGLVPVLVALGSGLLG